MRKIIAVLTIFISSYANSQVVNILSFTRNSATVTNSGTKIRTNIPVDLTGNFQPVVLIEGYSYTDASIVSLKVGWHIADIEFANATASSGGGFTPQIFLKEEAGKAVIYLTPIAGGEGIFRLSVSGIYQTNSQDEQDFYSNWEVNEVSFDPENNYGFEPERAVIYRNGFVGDTYVYGLLTAASASIPKANIGKLEVDKIKGVFDVVCGDFERGITLEPCDGGIEIISRNDNLSYIDFKGPQKATSDFQGRILHNDETGFTIYTNQAPKVTINNNGVVGIGTGVGFNPTGPYKLFVEGGMRTRKVKVDQVSPWPDYVFEPEYQLRSLSSLEAFIKVNKHLPDVPSADEIAKSGNDIGETQAMLLKKIEELTLYVIEQGKKIERLETQLKIKN